MPVQNNLYNWTDAEEISNDDFIFFTKPENLIYNIFQQEQIWMVLYQKSISL